MYTYIVVGVAVGGGTHCAWLPVNTAKMAKTFKQWLAMLYWSYNRSPGVAYGGATDCLVTQ